MTETVIRRAEAPEFGEGGTRITGYGSPTRGSESVAAWEVALDPGAGSPEHTLTHDEVFIVLGGEATFEIEGRRHQVGRGDAICVPPEVAFRLSNAGAERFTAICAMAAGGQARIGDGDPFPIPWAQ
ncbi:MAG TPA: cupin domain-containing protein [Solirubrobacteraceae bacterium]|jgi:quercetin dioxygenase-like cupin family protein|nr:cupin domain-containing protein [Solirubrobacteraceae bacterium]